MNAQDKDLTPPELEKSGVSMIQRRKLITGAAAAVVTLASRSALAVAGQGKSPSGYQSGNVSQGHIYACTGNNRAYYKTGGAGQNSWPNVSNCNKTNYFHTKFPSGGSCNLGSTKTHLQVINNSSNCDPTGIGGYFVAAMLNINNGLIDARVLTLPQLVTMFTQFSSTGSYQPMGNSSVIWNSAQIVTYFQQNNIVPA